MKLHGEYFWNIEKILAKESRPGGPHPIHEGGGRAPYLVGPLELLRPQLQLYIFTVGKKKSERRIHHVLRYGAAAKP